MNQIQRIALPVPVTCLGVPSMSAAGGHPNLIMTEAGVQSIRAELGRVPLFDATVKKVEPQADAELEQGIDVPIPKDYTGGCTHEQHELASLGRTSCVVIRCANR